MNQQQKIDFLERQVIALEREKSAALKALHMATSLGDFVEDYALHPDIEYILKEICKRTREMIGFRCATVYLIDEETQDIGQVFHDPPAYSELMNQEIDGLIRDQSFAYAMHSGKPCFFRTGDEDCLLLHVLATPTRIRGMFVGLLDQKKENILDTALSLFTVIMLAGAHAIANCELSLLHHKRHEELERQVQERTRSLEEAYSQLHAILSGIPAGVIVVDAATHEILEINPAGLRMMGRTLEEVTGHECFRFICPTLKGCCPITDKGQQMDNAERVLLTATGDEIPIIKTVSRVTLNGRPVLVETFVDISEEKRTARLKEDIQRITRHDLKAPLNGIIGLPDILLDSVPMDEDDKELLRLIKESGLRMLRMINLSLDIYKMETGTYKLHPLSIDMTAILRSAINEISDIVKLKKISVEFAINGEPVSGIHPIILFSEELLVYSLTSNLIKNAAEASPSSGIINIEISTNDDTIDLCICNMGSVPLPVRECFFEKYSTHGKQNGTGLGTYSAKLMTETLGGRIEMNTSETEGTRICVHLPRNVKTSEDESQETQNAL